MKSPSWLRMAQIGLGAIAVILSIAIIANPGFTAVLVVFTASILLLIVGIERVITGLFVQRKEQVATGYCWIRNISYTNSSSSYGVPYRNDSIVNASIGSRITI